MENPWLFRLSPSYHGATLFGCLSANHPELVSLGTTFPPKRHDPSCSCRRRVSECPFWQELSRRLAADRFVDCELLLPLLPQIVSFRRVNNRAASALAWTGAKFGRGVWRLVPQSRDEFLTSHRRFCKISAELQSKTQTVVGVEQALFVATLKSMLGRDARLRVVHLTRDPRGFFNSCRKYLSLTLAQVATWWLREHRRAESIAVRPYNCDVLRVRYEDLCADPAAAMNRVFRFYGLAEADVRRAPEPGTHVIGNKMIGDFCGEVRLDDAWRENVGPSQQRELIERTQPLSGKYGYCRN